jgi:hypothetical protein
MSAATFRIFAACPECGVQAEVREGMTGRFYEPAIFPRMCGGCIITENVCPTCSTSRCFHAKPDCEACGESHV